MVVFFNKEKRWSIHYLYTPFPYLLLTLKTYIMGFMCLYQVTFFKKRCSYGASEGLLNNSKTLFIAVFALYPTIIQNLSLVFLINGTVMILKTLGGNFLDEVGFLKLMILDQRRVK